jgi:hypothetical protein
MPFGGLAPFPLRLGASSDTSIAPEHWLRLCDDVIAQRHPIAVLHIVEGATAGACTVTGLCRGGTDVSAITATLTTPIAFNWRVTVTLGDGYTDSTTGEIVRWRIVNADAKQVGISTIDTVTIPNLPNTIYVSYIAAPRTGARQHTLIIFGETEQRWAGDYGAEPTKRACKGAGDVPYAAIWLQEMQAIRGDAFSTASGSYTQMENIACARVFAYLQNIAERHAANQLPMQADQSLGRWATIMDIGTTDDRDWQVRRKCAAKYALTTTGATQDALDAAGALLFGPNFHSIAWTPGTIDTPPPNTFWPAGDAGPGAYDLGGGPWSSSRCHFTVELTAANQAEAVRLLGLAHRDFDELILSALPPVVTWSFRFNPDNGFILDASRLNQEAL